jgi:hypothetical protein
LHFVLQLQEEKAVSGIERPDSDDKQAEFLKVTIDKQVEDSIFVVVNQLFDVVDFVQLIQVNLLPCLEVIVNHVFVRCHDCDCLLVIYLEELWLIS